MSKFFQSQFLFFLILIFLGFANGLPLILTGSTLSYWLAESGFGKEKIALFALISVPFSFKLFWTPLVDQYSLPFFNQSPRKGWMFFSLLGMSVSLFSLSDINPAIQPWSLGICLLFLILFGSCLYIVGISYELESLREDQYGIGSSYVIMGYRLGLMGAGSGALYLSYVQNWAWVYMCLSALVGIGAILVLLYPEPFKSKELILAKRERFSKYASTFQGFYQETIIRPCQSLIRKPDWLLIAFLLFTFKIGDQMAKNMEGPFYLSLGYNKAELAMASKLWGVVATICGAFLAGSFIKGRDPLLSLAFAGLMHACTLFSYYFLSFSMKSIALLYCVTALEHVTGGIAITIFIYFLWKICDKEFAPIQYALLWSLFTIKADFAAFLGGIIAHSTSWHVFYLVVSFVALSTALLSCYLLYRHLPDKQPGTIIT